MLLNFCIKCKVVKMPEESKSVCVNGLEVRSFHAKRREDTIEACKKAGFNQIFMPQLAEIRIGADKDSDLWNWCDSNSLCATGITDQGSRVAVYVHRSHYFSDPETVRTVIARDYEHFFMMPSVVRAIDFAGTIPTNVFQKLVDADGETGESGNRVVWVVDYDEIRKLPNYFEVNAESALELPYKTITIPFFGGEDTARKYLQKHRGVLGEKIGIAYYPTRIDGPPFGSFYGPNLGHTLWLGGRNEGNLAPGSLCEGIICGEGNLVGYKKL